MTASKIVGGQPGGNDLHEGIRDLGREEWVCRRRLQTPGTPEP